MFMGIEHSGERVCLINDGAHVARNHTWPNVLTDGVETARSFGSLQSAKCTARERQAFHKQRCEVDFALHAPHNTNAYNPAVWRGQIKVRLHEVTPGNVQNDIDLSRKTCRLELRRKIVLAVISDETSA
tara:strand:+ start:97 stop:483 length:387 start_codon:yes stop_codon:yes gene_type:complete